MNDGDRLVIPLDADEPARRVRSPKGSPSLALAAAAVAALVLAWLTRPPAPPATWEVIDLPEGSVNVESLIATRTGFAVAAAADRPGGAIWTTTGGETWDLRELERAPSRLVEQGAALVGYDSRTAFRIEDDGSIIDLRLPELLRTGYGSRRPGLVAGPNELLAQSVMGDLYRSLANGRFQLAVRAERWRAATDITLGSRCRPPERTGPDLPPVLSTGSLFFAFVAEEDASGVWPLCEPVVWTSGNGGAWKRESIRSPFGVGAYLTDVDWADDRFVAVGGFSFEDPAVWISDDGLEWERSDAPGATGGYELIEVQGGPAGWIAVGKWSNRSGYVAWYSTDGADWDVLPEGVGGRTVAVGTDVMLIADRSNPGKAWLGTVTRSSR